MASVVGEAAGELREDIPLKSGTKHTSLCSCNERFLGGSRLITTAFAFLTTIITVALLVQIYYGDFQVVPHGSVASDNRECSEIGTSILKRGGNAVDAAIASAFCLCVVNPHNVGLDATGQILIYNHRTQQNAVAMNFSDLIHTPRLVSSLAYVHDFHGSISWKECILPSANLARKGFLISKQLEKAVKNVRAENIFGLLEAGVKINLISLANTLTKIANTPPKELYVNITSFNTDVLNSTFIKFNIYVPSTAPGSQLLNVVQQMKQLNITNISKTVYVYKLADVMKHLNLTDIGTSTNVAVIDQNELYVSLVIGMHAVFGSRTMTPDGYLLDVTNTTQFYSRVPFIITDANFKCGRRIVSGANDVVTATQVLVNLLVDGENITSSVEFPRFILLQDRSIGLEDAHRPTFSDAVIQQLQNLGTLQTLKEPYDSCNIVEKIADDLNSHSDSRGGGISSRF